MHPCALLLGEVLVLAQLEEEALATEDTEQAEELAQKRSELLVQAWKEREGYDEGLLLNTLLVVDAMQERLSEAATLLHQKLSAALQTTRRHGKYFAGYRQSVAQADRAHYCDTVS